MSFLQRIDAWLGKTLFHPLIILLCQVTRQTQYAVSRGLWFLALCQAAYVVDGWAERILVGLLLTMALISATMFADRPNRSFGWFRFLIWSMLIRVLARILTGGAAEYDLIYFVTILFAEYAATISTIPPGRKRQHRAGGTATTRT